MHKMATSNAPSSACMICCATDGDLKKSRGKKRKGVKKLRKMDPCDIVLEAVPDFDKRSAVRARLGGSQALTRAQSHQR